MKIAFFTLNAYDMLTRSPDGSTVGGAQLQQILVGKELERRDHDIYFVEYDAESKTEQTIDGINIVLKPRPRGNALQRTVTGISGTLDVFRRIEPDVCYRRALDFEIIVLSVLCKLFNSQFVYGIAHDNNLDDVPDTFGSGIKNTRLYGKLNQAAISAADAVIAQNTYQYTRAQQRLDTSVYKVTNCYEPGSPEPIPELADNESLVVLWVSRFTDFKRPELAVEIAEACPDIEFVMIGTESDTQLFERMQSRADELDNVRFEGFVPFAEIDRYFRSADVFLNTSRQEGFPNTFLQSWAYKKPVVSLTVDPDDIFTEHGAGWVLSDSVPEAVDLLNRLADDPDHRTEVGERAYRYFQDNHSIAAIVDEYGRVFTDAVTESK